MLKYVAHRDRSIARGRLFGPNGPAEAPSPEPWNGITPPTRVGVGARFLTDVILDLGLVSPERVEAAIETARSAGRKAWPTTSATA